VADIIKLTAILFVISALAALAISGTYSIASPKIELQKRREQEQALQAVFPPGARIEETKGSAPLPPLYWTAKNADGKILGYAFATAGKGYSSDIRCIVGVEPGGAILGMKVLSQAETPGLGTRVMEVVSTSYLWNSLFKKKTAGEPWFQSQFKGLNARRPFAVKTKVDEWHTCPPDARRALAAENAVTAITGATISTRAVVNAIETTVPNYLKAIERMSGRDEHQEGAAVDDTAGVETRNN